MDSKLTVPVKNFNISKILLSSFIICILLCGCGNTNSVSDKNNKDVSDMVIKFNDVMKQAKSIDDNADLYSKENYQRVTQKLALIKQAHDILKDIEAKGLVDKLEGFEVQKQSVSLQLQGLTMEKDGLEKMIENGTIK